MIPSDWLSSAPARSKSAALSTDSVRRPESKRCTWVSATPSSASFPAGMSS